MENNTTTRWNTAPTSTAIFAIFRREVRANRNRLLSWSIPLLLLVFLAMSMLPTFAQDSSLIDLKMKALPPALVKALGMGQINLSEAIGFYGGAIYLYITLIGSMFAALLSTNILAKEEGERTAEFLLAKPVSRGLVVGAKALATFFYVFLFNALLAGVCYLSFELYAPNGYDMGTVAQLIVGQTLIISSFAGLGLFASAALRKARTALPVAMGGVLGTYVLGAISAIASPLDWTRWFSPFKYADATEIIQQGGLPFHSLMLAGIALGATLLAYVLYNKKDIAA